MPPLWRYTNCRWTYTVSHLAFRPLGDLLNGMFIRSETAHRAEWQWYQDPSFGDEGSGDRY
jgi:hypothetical protein